LLEQDIADAISESCQEIIDGQHIEQFPVDVFQTGSGTSSNMNTNEVITTLAVSAALAAENQLVPALKYLSDKTEEKAKTLEHVVKTGRTHLMDAMPVTLTQELRGWKYQIDSAINGIQETLPRVKALSQGGTAVGTGINVVPEFSGLFAKHISASTGVSFQPSENFFYNMSSQDAIVSLSGQLKTGAVAIMKIANDLRWMNSGSLAGLGEIELQALQPVRFFHYAG
jgi:fumarate hydratase class II